MNMNNNIPVRDCAFQYATINKDLIRGISIDCDRSELTLEEAKALWNEYYPKAARAIDSGLQVQMYLWVNMQDSSDYTETLWQIDVHAQSDGVKIWKTERIDFPKKL